MRRRMQSFLRPLLGTGRADGHGHGYSGYGPRSSSRLLVLAMGSIMALALVSTVMLSSSISMRSGAVLRGPVVMLSSTKTTPQPTQPEAQPTPQQLQQQQETQAPTSPPTTTTAVPQESQQPQTKSPQENRAEAEQKLASQRARVATVADSLIRLAQQTTQQRGIVLPLFDGIATLGISLILELRDMGVDAPIEVPHCGDLHEELRNKLQEHDANVRVYDVCLEASAYTIRRNAGHKLFCRDLNDCHMRFRNFDIKIIALLLSRFEEVMMLDADTLFFQNPMSVWHTKKYTTTGTLFFHDRMSCDKQFLALPRPQRRGITALEEYLSDFDPEPFKRLPSEDRPPVDPLKTPARKPFVAYTPSEFLSTSHSWNRRAGHQADSSLMLWNKKRQARATAILGSFIAHGGVGRPPSYGDKEFYWMASELAGAAYAFSDYGTGAVGTDVRQPEAIGQSVLCGDALHYVPEDAGASDPATLYINSDRILEFRATDDLYRSRARPASLYPGPIEARGVAQECPFDVVVERLTPVEKELLTRRQKFHDIALSWLPSGDQAAFQRKKE